MAATNGPDEQDLLLDLTREAVVRRDRSGRISLWNAAAEAIFGYARDEAIGAEHARLLSPRLPAPASVIDEALREHGRWGGEVVYRTRDGAEVVVDCRWALRSEPDGTSVVWEVASDVTERRRMEQALRERNAQLAELDRLKDAFVDGVSHELRTPLSTILGYAEFLADGMGGPLTPDQRTFVDAIQGGCERLRRLVDDLIDFSRLSSGTFKLLPELVDFGAKVVEVTEALAPTAEEKQLELTASVPEGSQFAMADPGRIDQILLNLIGNAIKFTPEGGAVAVRLLACGDELRVEVEDSGIGIAREHQPKLFSRFFQADPSTTREAGGTGLGLSITKALVEAHGGRIGFASEPGEGSCFWFTLPSPRTERLRMTLYPETEPFIGARSPER